MPLDQVENFVEVNVSGTHSSTETIISLQSGEASNLPDPASGEFNLVWFDSTNFSRPSEDNSVEIVRVTGRDITNDTITVLRGQENTTAVAHDTSNSDYVMILAQTAKMIEDVDAADFSTNTVTVAGNSVALGSSTAVNHSDLSNIGTGDHHTRYSDEEAQDAVGGILNADFSYDDAGNSIALASNSLSVAGNSVALGGSTAVATGDLSDQNITTPSAGQTILYDASAGEFVNGFISTGTALGSTSGDGVFTLNVQEGNISHDNLQTYGIILHRLHVKTRYRLSRAMSCRLKSVKPVTKSTGYDESWDLNRYYGQAKQNVSWQKPLTIERRVQTTGQAWPV